MAQEHLSNSVRAGVFVLTCIGLAAAVGFALMRSDIFSHRKPYVVRFSIEDGVAGLSEGSDVQVGGLSRGRVLAVEPKIDSATGDVSQIDVDIEIDESIHLYARTSPPGAPDDGPRVLRVASPLGNTATLNFISVGVPRLDDRKMPSNLILPGTVIEASIGSGLLASLVGADNAAQVGTILRNISNFSKSLDEQGSPFLADARSVADRFSADYDTWRESVTKALANADSSLERINGYLAPKAQVEVFLDDAVGTAQAAKSVMVEARDEAMPKIERILDSAYESVESLDATLEQAQAELTAQIPTIRSFLSNAREAATQLKLGTLEVRRNPWRLFAQHTPAEIANENLYQAAADFAVATSDLNVTTESLRAILADDRSRFAKDPEFRARLEGEVLHSIDRFEAARTKLAEILHASPELKRSAP